jgi:signal transduction histidine kinase
MPAAEGDHSAKVREAGGVSVGFRQRRSLPTSVQVLPLLVCGVSLVLVAIAAAVGFVDRALVVDAPVPEPVAWFVPVQATGAVVWAVASLALLHRRDLVWSRLSAVASLSHALAAASFAWAVHGLVGGHGAPGAEVAAALTLMLLPVEMPVSIYLLVSLPKGRLTSAGVDRLGWLAIAMATAGVCLELVTDPDTGGTAFAAARNPLSLGIGPGPWAALLVAPSAVIALGVLLVKWRKSTGADRLALRWVVWTQLAGTLVVVPLFAFVSHEVSVGAAQVASALGLLVLVTVIRRQHLLGVERLFERALRFVVLAGLLAVVYGAVIAAGTELVGGAARLLAAAIVALLVLPLRDRVGHGVARFVYGDRANAAEIVRGVAERAATALAPCELLERFLEDLLIGTGAGAAAVELEGHGTIASTGISTPAGGNAVVISLVHRDRGMGWLTVQPGPGEACLDPAAEQVLNEVAPHIAMAADACRADIELQQARTRLVQAREEERRRLRHDLHDGLGPILTGVAFSADAAANLVATNPHEASELIAASRRNVGLALDEIRRIVEDLRPPALDELGLAGAIRQHAQRLPQLEVVVSGVLPDRLPAAAEVAAYRIATEALTNVARHAAASRAEVDVTLNGRLAVTITDNGHGSAPWRPGVGLNSMSSRARELGGELHAGPGPTGGGRVAALLPVDP